MFRCTYWLILWAVCYTTLLNLHVQGQYTLSASNSYGTPGTTFTLTCITSPVQTAVTWSENYTLSRGSRNTANYIYVYNAGQCQKSTGASPSDYNFNCNSSGVFTLTFTVSYTRHKGSEWTCGVVQGDSISNKITLNIKVPVSSVTLVNITNNNQEISLTEDSTLVLSCRTSFSYPAPTVTWYINDTPTSSGVVSQIVAQVSSQVVTVSTITRTMRRDNDRDQIYCTAENVFGEIQSWTARVKVYYGPDNDQISLSQPSAVAERTPVILTCRTLTSVNPEVDFSWAYGDNTRITSGIGAKQGSARSTWSQTLTVTPVRNSNRQVIKCDVRNTETSVDVETTLDLDVNYGPDNGEVRVKKSSTAIEHDPVTLTCRTTNNVKPDVTFTWTLDRSEVTSGTGSKLGSSGRTWSQTLTLIPTRNQRTVGCTVSNSLISRQDSSSVDLDVNYPPDIGISPVEGTEKADLTLRCNATGNPSIYQFDDFTQYWGNQLIQRRAGSQSGDRYDLTLSRVTYQDSGVYVCTVGNKVKQPRHRNTTVTVKANPVFTKDSKNNQRVGADINQNVTLNQYIYCSPNCTSFTWNFNSSSTMSQCRVHLDVYGVDVEEDGYNLSYTIRSFQQKDVGLYTVTVCNSVGCSDAFVSLTESGPPVTPESFRAVDSTTDSVALSWEPQYAGSNYKQEFHVEYKKYNTTNEGLKKIFPDSGEDIMLGVVKGLTANTEYVFRIMSVTDRKTGNNKSPYSPEITSHTTKDIEVTMPPSSASIGIGAGIGIGVGISVVIVVAAVAVFILFRHFRVRNTERGASQQSDYSHLQYNANQNTYETIVHTYQNTGIEMTRSDEDADTPQNQTYVNASQTTPGRVNENTSFTAN